MIHLCMSIRKHLDRTFQQIDSTPGRETCNYPANSQPTCTQSNVCCFTVRNVRFASADRFISLPFRSTSAILVSNRLEMNVFSHR